MSNANESTNSLAHSHYPSSTQGYANVGFNNPKNVHTPNMNKLVQDGIILKRHYTFRWCAPTRSALMTGRLPYHVYQQGSHVTRGYTMLPRKLQQVGYETHQVGQLLFQSRTTQHGKRTRAYRHVHHFKTLSIMQAIDPESGW